MTTKTIPTRKKRRLMQDQEADEFIRGEVESALSETGYVFTRSVGIVAPKKLCKLVSALANRWWFSLTGRPSKERK